MPSAAKIVEVTAPGQIEEVRSLFREYQSALPKQYRFSDHEWLGLPGEYASPQGALLLATVAGGLAGCVGLRPFPLPNACEMKRLFVRPEFRGLKVGNVLVEQVIQVALRLGYSHLRLDTPPSTMQAATFRPIRPREPRHVSRIDVRHFSIKSVTSHSSMSSSVAKETRGNSSFACLSPDK
jgi:putative acetyltransferase